VAAEALQVLLDELGELRARRRAHRGDGRCRERVELAKGPDHARTASERRRRTDGLVDDPPN
jgi:hypothetical protein